jgi:hypothetical protein
LVRLHPELAGAAAKFVRVRLVKIAGADLRLFEFDYDLTWYVFFLNADETIYGRYGGRDAADPHARISPKGLRFAMDRALEAHRRPSPPPIDRAKPPLLAEKFPAAARHQGCIHCHNVNEFRRAEAKAANRWDRRDVWVYPLPENVGLTLDVDAGDRVKSVIAGSAAERVGLLAGDAVHRLNGKSVASFADASHALHDAPSSGSIPIEWSRNGVVRSGTLDVKDGWKKTNLTWRPSMLDLLPSLPFSGDDLTADEKRSLGISPNRAAFRQGGKVHSTLAAAGVQAGDVVIGVDGAVLHGGMGELLGHVRRHYLVGDAIIVDVLRDGKPTSVRLTLQ